MTTIQSDNYSIIVGKDVFSSFDFFSYSKIAILVDENTFKYCYPKLTRILDLDHDIITIVSGEENKTIETCNYVWDKLRFCGFDRDSLLISLGGGVIGDLGGFVASTYKRGIDFLQIPTTLVAMVDASIGGKVGVNLDSHKNYIGAFYNPVSVLIFPEFLDTLPIEHIKSGVVEVIKHYLISSKDYWYELIGLDLDSLDLEEVIIRSLEIKNKIVLSDPFENGDRRKLNFGHTFGHAIESKNNISHGQAISLGIVLACNTSNKLGYLKKEKIQRIHGLLSKFDLPTDISEIDRKELLPYVLKDKKAKRRDIDFIVLKDIGKADIINIPIEKIIYE